MEEISNLTQIETDQSGVFLEGLEDAPAAVDQPLAQTDQSPAEEASQAAEAAELAPPVAKAGPDRQAQEADIQADLASFATAFPEIFDRAKDDPGVIPQCVWDTMRSQGLSLTAAYARYVTGQAKTAAGNQSNAARSTGSMRSAGNDGKNNDAFLSAFDA